MEKENLLEQYKKIREMNISYQEKMTLSLKFLSENCLYNLYEANVIAVELIEEARRENDSFSLAELFLRKAWYKIELGQLVTACMLLLESLEIYSQFNNIKGVMRAHNMLGYSYSVLGNPEKGFKHYVKALNIASELKELEEMVPIYGNMAGNLTSLKRYEEALSYYKKILKFEQQRTEYKIITQEGMGYVYYVLGENEKAFSCYSEAYHLADKENLNYYKSGMLMRLGTIYQKSGDFKEAEASYKKALEYGKKSKLPRLEINALFNLGILHNEQNELARALEFFNKAYEMALEAEMVPSQISSLEYIWEILAKSLKWEEALDYIKKFHRKYLELHNQETLNTIDRLKMEEAIKEKEFYQEMHSGLAIISSIGKELTSSLETVGIVEIMSRQIKNIMDLDLFGLGFYDAERESIEYQFFLKDRKWGESYQVDIEDKNSLSVWCLENKKEILINNLEKEYVQYIGDISRLKALTKDVKSLIYAPLLVGTKVIGVLFVHSQNLAAYKDYQVEMLKVLAAYLAIAFENSKLFEEVKHLAIRDPLTGLYNRRHFLELAGRELERYKRYGKNFVLIMLDLDHFKEVNDRYGHANGDLVLKGIANFLTKNIRRTDILCRYGGEEFIIFLADLSLEAAIRKANSLREGLSELIIELNTGESLTIKASFGLTEVLKDDENLDKVIKRADLALYEAKEKGRNRVCTF